MGRYLTTRELAPLLRRSIWSVYRDARAGKIPYLRVNDRGKLLFDPQAVEAALCPKGQPAPAPTPAA